MGALITVLPVDTLLISDPFLPNDNAARGFEEPTVLDIRSLGALTAPPSQKENPCSGIKDIHCRNNLSPRQHMIRHIAAFLLGDDTNLSDMRTVCQELGELGYSISGIEWQELYSGTLEGIPQAVSARQAIARDMWHRMYNEGVLSQRKELVAILQKLPFDDLFEEGVGIEASREIAPLPPRPRIQWREGISEFDAGSSNESGREGTGGRPIKDPPSQDARISDSSTIDMKREWLSKRTPSKSVETTKDQMLVEELIYLKQVEVKKLAELLIPGILSHHDSTRFFGVLGELIPTTSSSMWRRIFFEGAGFGAQTDDVRKATERSIVTALCARVADVGAIAAAELSKIDWEVLNANIGGEVGTYEKSVNHSDESAATTSQEDVEGIESGSKDTYFTTTAQNGLKIIASASAALSARLRAVRKEALRRCGFRGNARDISRTPEVLERVEGFFRRERQHQNIFECIDAVGHDEDFAPHVDDGFHPTDAPAGSEEKKNVLMWRNDRGYPLWHQNDRTDYRLISGALAPLIEEGELEDECEKPLPPGTVNQV